MPKIAAICGSFRTAAFSRKVMNVAVEGARVAGAEVDVIDIRDAALPIYDQDDVDANGFNPKALAQQERLAACDGLIISSPEYNYSIPGGLKNYIDWVSRTNDKFAVNEVFRGKPVSLITSSPGPFGGIRCLTHMRSFLGIMGMIVLPTEVAVMSVAQKLDASGMTDDATRTLLEKLGSEIAAAAAKK